jgi:hypothetical protein
MTIVSTAAKNGDLAVERLSLLCARCGNEGDALRVAGDTLVFSTLGDFYLRYPSIQSSFIQVVCGRCDHVIPLGRGAHLPKS